MAAAVRRVELDPTLRSLQRMLDDASFALACPSRGVNVREGVEVVDDQGRILLDVRPSARRRPDLLPVGPCLLGES